MSAAKTISGLTALLIALFSAPAFATYYSCDYEYYVSVHYSGVAWGKTVESVTAHVGVVQHEKNNATGEYKSYWNPNTIADAAMVRQNDHFFVKLRTAGTHGGGNGSITLENYGPFVQYFVKFTDGTTHTSMTLPVTIHQAYGPIKLVESQKALAAFERQTDTPATQAFAIYSGNGCAN